MRERDRMIFVAQMIARLGFVIAIVLGLGMLFRMITGGGLVMIHILAGAMVVLGALLATVRAATTGRSAGPLAGALALSLLGAWLGITNRGGALFSGSGIVHLIIMIAAVGLLEMGGARANKGR